MSLLEQITWLPVWSFKQRFALYVGVSILAAVITGAAIFTGN